MQSLKTNSETMGEPHKEKEMEQLTYSNPRMSAVIENWPSGSKRVTAQFEIEQNGKRGERAVRTTDGAPKKRTYAKYARIVDGSDGRTYIAEFTIYGTVSIAKGDMQFQHESIHERDARYAEALELFADVISAEWRAKLVARGK